MKKKLGIETGKTGVHFTTNGSLKKGLCFDPVQGENIRKCRGHEQVDREE